MQITDKEQVTPVLHKLFTNHNVAKATHNIYAYRLKCGNGTIENSCDDGEFGAGRKLLNLMRDKNITNTMVIVTRWYGGIHMGPKRFHCILTSASDALAQIDI